MWIWVARWIKGGKLSDEEIKKAAANLRKHWEEAALDVGFDPAKTVTTAEGPREIRVGISEELDMAFREEPGEWRYY